MDQGQKLLSTEMDVDDCHDWCELMMRGTDLLVYTAQAKAIKMGTIWVSAFATRQELTAMAMTPHVSQYVAGMGPKPSIR